MIELLGFGLGTGLFAEAFGALDDSAAPSAGGDGGEGFKGAAEVAHGGVGAALGDGFHLEGGFRHEAHGGFDADASERVGGCLMADLAEEAAERAGGHVDLAGDFGDGGVLGDVLGEPGEGGLDRAHGVALGELFVEGGQLGEDEDGEVEVGALEAQIAQKVGLAEIVAEFGDELLEPAAVLCVEWDLELAVVAHEGFELGGDRAEVEGGDEGAMVAVASPAVGAASGKNPARAAAEFLVGLAGHDGGAFAFEHGVEFPV